MIFLGDIAIPPNVFPVHCAKTQRLFESKAVAANLEGALIRDGEPLLERHVLFNDESRTLAYLEQSNIKLVSLANNHILDVSENPAYTIRTLRARGIQSCGAGACLEEAMSPAMVTDGANDLLFLAFGWEVIECKAATEKSPGVCPLTPKVVLDAIRQARERHPGRRIVLFMHWNYELELYPQPMHRQLAFAAVDAGADGVIGCHSHCVQGFEIYRGAPIVYGLGNWFLPHGIFFGGRLKYPDICLKQLAFEWDLDKDRFRFHWFRYNPQSHRIDWEKTEDAKQSEEMNHLSPFRAMSHNEYIAWFGKNRRKKALLPVYKKMSTPAVNRLKDIWVRQRQNGIRWLYDLGLKGGAK